MPTLKSEPANLDLKASSDAYGGRADTRSIPSTATAARCAPIRHLQEAHLHELESVLPCGAASDTLNPVMQGDTCVAGPTDAWGVVWSDTKCKHSTKPEELLVHAQLVHVGSNGAMRAAKLDQAFDLLGGFPIEVRLSVVDYDGNGSSEVAVSMLQEVNPECCYNAVRAVFSADRSAVVPYAPAARIIQSDGLVEFRDVDADGKPDIVTHGGYISTKRDTSYELRSGCIGAGNRTPDFLAHALESGEFSRDDDLARRFVAERCTNQASRNLLSDVVARPNDEMGMLVVCRRLAGQSVDEVSTFLRKTCRPLNPGETSCDGQGNSRPVCYYYQDYERWVKQTPPFRIDTARERANQSESVRPQLAWTTHG